MNKLVLEKDSDMKTEIIIRCQEQTIRSPQENKDCQNSESSNRIK